VNGNKILGQWACLIDPLRSDMAKLRRIVIYGTLVLTFVVLLVLVIGIVIAEDIPSIDELSAWIGMHVKVGETRYAQLQQLLNDELQDLQCTAEEDEKRSGNVDNISTTSIIKCFTRHYHNSDGSNLFEGFVNYLFTSSYYRIRFQFQDSVLHNVEIEIIRISI
jgi:hypothetical protein